MLLRGALLALPFLIWFAWSELARRRGRPPMPTPWGWLIGIGALLVGLSLMAGGLFHADNRGAVYVPGEVTADGRVTEGRYERPTSP